ncbi:MAG: flagellar motor switch protein FliN [Nitrospirae bacterium]|nr:flagellar motor switch protein FliN [Nitrospirota bacterium]
MNLESGWDEALKDMTSAEPRPAPPQAGKKVQAKAFDTIEAVEPEPGAQPRNLEIILDIPMEITAELGKTRIMVQDFLRLGMGSIIELQKAAGEPVEILVNGTLVARGEVVVVNEKFGVRLTDIISQAERIKKLV